jgi:putative DNA primase/helicase
MNTPDIIRDCWNRLGWRFICANGKQPLRTGTFGKTIKRETSLGEVLTHLHGGGNIGLITGAPSGGLLVLDYDPGAALPDPLPDTVIVRTGRGGLHVYYLMPPGHALTNSTNGAALGPHIDVRGEGGFVVFPPSLHPDTMQRYAFEPGHGPHEMALAPLPDSILHALTAKPERKQVQRASNSARDTNAARRYALSVLEGEAAKVTSAAPGTRNATLNTGALLCCFRDWPVSHDEIEGRMLEAALDAGLPEREARATIASALKAGANDPREIPESARRNGNGAHQGKAHADASEAPEGGDLDAVRTARLTMATAARRLAELHGPDIRHHSGLGWLAWDGRRWGQDEKDVMLRARDLREEILRERELRGYAQPGCEGLSKAYHRHAREVHSDKGLRAVLHLAQSEPGINGDGIEWDAHPDLLNCANGTIDLRTGKLGMHRREHYLTQCTPLEFDPNAQCPRFEQFLAEIFFGERALVDYFQWVAGYSLTGDISAQVWFILHGCGANGKTTLLDALRFALGPDYAHQLDPDELLQHPLARHSTERAALRGKRLVLASESPEGRRLNEPLIKSLTGGDPQRARFMRENSFEFFPVLKLFLGTNHRPSVRDDSGGFWRRVRLIPFNATFPPESRDPSLPEKLHGEAPGILAWAVRGAMRHFAQGEPEVPEQVRAAGQEWQTDSDRIAEFLEAECLRNAAMRCGKSDLYKAFTKWGGGGESLRSFNRRMEARGFAEGRMTGGKTCWLGIGLAAQSGAE